jgi:NADH-quinone oxidoreductase subunit N
MNLGAFLIVMFVADKTGSEEIEDYAGLGYRSPFLAVCLTIFLVSLAGIPPTAGFTGKLYIFTAVLNSNYVWLAVVGIINSVVALFYYANVFRNMFMRNMDTTESKFTVSRAGIILVLVTVIPTLLFGVWWSPIAAWAKHSVAMFLFK